MTDKLATDWILNHLFPPNECCDCPFATATVGEDQPNPTDPGEGYYDCALLKRSHIWGESPACSHEQWLARAKIELNELINDK